MTNIILIILIIVFIIRNFIVYKYDKNTIKQNIESFEMRKKEHNFSINYHEVRLETEKLNNEKQKIMNEKEKAINKLMKTNKAIMVLERNEYKKIIEVLKRKK